MFSKSCFLQRVKMSIYGGNVLKKKLVVCQSDGVDSCIVKKKKKKTLNASTKGFGPVQPAQYVQAELGRNV